MTSVIHAHYGASLEQNVDRGVGVYLSLVSILSDVPKDKRREFRSVLPSLEGAKLM